MTVLTRLTENLEARASVDYYWSSSTNATLEGDPRYAHDAYGLLGARVDVESSAGRWAASLFGRNLTNELYSNGIYKNGDSIVRLAGYERTYGASVEWRWR